MNCALLLLAFLGQTDPSDTEAQAREALSKAAAALKKLESAAYAITWKLPSTAGSTRFEARVRMRRPGQRRIDGAFKSPGRNDPVLYVFDGKEECCLDINENRYYRRPQVINGSYSTWEDVISLFYFDEPFKAWMEFGTKPHLLRESADEKVVEWRIRYTGDVRWRLHLDGSYAVRRLEKFVGETLFLDVEYSKFESNPKLEDDLFRFNPPAGARPRRGSEEYEQKLIAVGAEAPDFEYVDLQGRPAALSAWKGKPVLFVTWSFP